MATVTNFDLDTALAGNDEARLYTEGGAAIRLAPNAALSASGNFNGQTLRISPLLAEDVLGFASGVTVVGTSLQVGGATIGTFTGGTGGADLVITFTNNATASRVQSLLQNITFQDTSDVPTVNQTLKFNLAGTIRTDVVTVTPVNDAPVLDLNVAASGKSATLSYTENEPLKAIAPSAVVSDVDSTNFGSGSLRVAFTNNGTSTDQLGIKTDGVVTISANIVSVGVTAVGTVSGGSNGTALVISLNNDATPALVTTLLQHIGYSSTSENPSTNARTVSFTINDGDGTANGGHNTDVATATINVTSVNDAPIVDLNGAGSGTSATLIYKTNDPLTKIAPAAIVTDVDSANFAGGSLHVAFTQNGTADDRLAILTDATVTLAKGTTVKIDGIPIGTVSGGTGGSDLVVTFTGTATPERVQILLEHIGYADSSSSPSMLTREVTFTINDGDGTANGGHNIGSATATISFPVIKGVVLDGYIAGATIFADEHSNGVLDPDEASTTTDATGNFVLINGHGPLVMSGGIDISTILAFTGVMRAPAGSTVVTPLTTLVVAVAEATGLPAEANDQVLAALGLDLGIDLSSFDPVAATLSSDLTQQSQGTAAVAAATQLQNTIVQAASLLQGAGASADAAAAAVITALANQVSGLEQDQTLDLTDASVTGVLTTVITDAAFATSTDVTNTATGAASVIAASNVIVNTIISDAATNGATSTDLLTSLAQVSVVAQGDASTALTDAGAAGAIGDDVVTNFTTNLATAVNNATVGDVAGGPAVLNSVSLTADADVVGPTAANLTIYGNATTLNAGDSLDGSGGANDKLVLFGPGSFNLNTLAGYTDIEQVQLVTAAGSTTGVALRGGTTTDLVSVIGDGGTSIGVGGKIQAASVNTIQGGGGDDQFIIFGDSSGAATVGTILGGNGNDVLSSRGGTISSIDMGAGDDSLTLEILGSKSSQVGSIDMGDGNNSVSLTFGGHADTIHTGSGSDGIDLATVASATSIDTGDGNDGINVGGSCVVNNFDMGAGDDLIRFSGNLGFSQSLISKIDGGDGTDKIAIAGTGSFDFNNVGIFANIEQIELANSSSTEVDLFLKSGSSVDSVTATDAESAAVFLSGASVVGSIDSLNNGKMIVQLNDSSHVNSLHTGSANDSVFLFGSSSVGSADLGDGNNNVLNLGSGSLGSIQTGSGNDIISFNSAGSATSIVLGDGQDSITFGASSVWNPTTIDGGDGAFDSLNLNQSNMTFDLASTTTGIEILSLGGSNDTALVNASILAELTNLQGNSSTKLVTDQSTVDFTGKFMSGGITIESSNATGTTFTGSNFDDNFRGGNGDDRLTGAGSHDILTGGNGADTFVYDSPFEGMDTIVDFTDGSDTLEFSASGFGGGLTAGTLTTAEFGSSDNADFGSTDERFHFDTTSHTLYYDADGSGNAAAAFAVAQFLNDVTLHPSNIIIAS